MNVPLPAGTGDDAFLAAYVDAVEPALAAFEADLLLVSAGFDAAAVDPVGGMELTEEGFRELANRAASLAPRLALVLEGGYAVDALPGLVRAAAEGAVSGRT